MTSHRPDQMAAIRIFGQVSAPDFPEWITRHATKLGLRDVTLTLHNDHLGVRATGQDEMLNALSLACSLGPKSALVDRVVIELNYGHETAWHDT